jgi:ribosomal protein S18 acetylase RimI-like enzyme
LTREFLPFTAEHIAPAAELLSRRHAAQREQEPRLAASYESTAVTQPMIEALLWRSTGVVALEHGEMVGYLLGSADAPIPGDTSPRARTITMEGHAAMTDNATELYREMYAAVAAGWNEDGFFTHRANLSALDRNALEAFYSLGFGQTLAIGLRDMAPIPGANTAIRIERATPANIDVVQRLMMGMGRYNSTSPLFRPYMAPVELEWSRKPVILEQLADEDFALWLAYEGDEAVAIMIFRPPEQTELMANPDDSVYLWFAIVQPGTRIGGIGKAMVNNGLRWARERELKHCTVSWFTANVVGARFWRERGYEPVLLRVERRIDERIAWARAADL